MKRFAHFTFKDTTSYLIQMSKTNYKSSNQGALSFLITPIILASVSLILYRINSQLTYYTSIFLLSVFFAQTFIILHECGHLSFFPSRSMNKLIGNVAGILTGIPFFTWMHMHNLHHKWTGWRDLDPTTEKTVKPGGSKIEQMIVNIAWLLFIPLFFLTYMISNYWNLLKIKRFVSSRTFKQSVIAITLYLILYTMLIYFFFTPIIKFALPSFILSLIWKELMIMTQHTHIEIPVSDGAQVRPISYEEQKKYTRSFYLIPFIEKYILLNFNLHETHHVYPGLPAYWLDKLDVNKSRSPSFWSWFKTSKSMKGEDYVFRTSKHTGKYF